MQMMNVLAVVYFEVPTYLTKGAEEDNKGTH
jgi:hypothetical protein